MATNFYIIELILSFKSSATTYSNLSKYWNYAKLKKDFIELNRPIVK